jgi:leader peptidase (prepilin peptidase)/N-methyltransferase
VIIKLFYLCTGKIGMGNGDFKLFAALAAWFGWTALTPILLMACMLGIIIGSLYLWHQKKIATTRFLLVPISALQDYLIYFFRC